MMTFGADMTFALESFIIDVAFIFYKVSLTAQTAVRRSMGKIGKLVNVYSAHCTVAQIIIAVVKALRIEAVSRQFGSFDEISLGVFGAVFIYIIVIFGIRKDTF